MKAKTHNYQVSLVWIGNRGTGTVDYASYGRDHEIVCANKEKITCSSDPEFRGDGSLWNPEDLFVASLSACHQLWYLSLCTQNNVNVLSYVDNAEGLMVEETGGEGQFELVILKPVVMVSNDSDADLAFNIHTKAHEMCFIARSVNFPVECRPVIHFG